MKKPKTYALDIFRVLKELNSENLNFWDQLSEEERKGFAPYTAIRWMSGTKDAKAIILLNEFVNPYVFAFNSTHQELLMKLLASCGSGNPNTRTQWIPEGKKGSNKPLSLKIICEYYEYSMREAKQSLSLLSNEDVVELAEELGWQKDEIKNLKLELSK